MIAGILWVIFWGARLSTLFLGFEAARSLFVHGREHAQAGDVGGISATTALILFCLLVYFFPSAWTWIKLNCLVPLFRWLKAQWVEIDAEASKPAGGTK